MSVFKITSLLKHHVLGKCYFIQTNGKLFAIEKDALERVLGPISKIMKRSIDVFEKYKSGSTDNWSS